MTTGHAASNPLLALTFQNLHQVLGDQIYKPFTVAEFLKAKAKWLQHAQSHNLAELIAMKLTKDLEANSPQVEADRVKRYQGIAEITISAVIDELNGFSRDLTSFLQLHSVPTEAALVASGTFALHPLAHQLYVQGELTLERLAKLQPYAFATHIL